LSEDFVQFEDGSTWGDFQAARNMLAERPQRLAFLQHLVETYDKNGDIAFASLLNEPKMDLLNTRWPGA
jgi:hypothetical protein